MSSQDRHINFSLMRQYILDQQDKVVALQVPADPENTDRKKDYWRSLDELSDSPEFREFVQREYPQHAEDWDDPIERRTFLKLMGASLALAGLSGCVYQPPEKIVPYVRQPEEEVPGKALFFATASTLSGIAMPLLARSNEGRPTKLEGNPEHPTSSSNDLNSTASSATDIFSQASVLSLYDPDRSQTTLYRDESRPWSTFVGELRTALDEQRSKQGSGLRFLTETITSPTLAAQLQSILAEFPQARWHQYEPTNNDNALAGAKIAFGQPVNTIYRFDQADLVLSLESDFLACLPGTLKYARDFGTRRRVIETNKQMCRLYVVESTPTVTGAKADHRFSVRPSEVEAIARTLEVLLSIGASQREALDIRGKDAAVFKAIVNDLQAHKGSSLVIPGKEATPVVHALAHAMNDALGNVGKTVFYTDPLEANPVDQRQSLQELVSDIDGGRVDLLVILGGNPVYNTPADLKLDQTRMSRVKLRVHLSFYRDETSELCHWHIPETHYLEAWSDTRAHDGTVTIVQPLIEPLYQNKSAHELLAVFSPQYDRKPYDIIRDYWQAAQKAGSKQQESGASQQEPSTAQQRATGLRPIGAGQPPAPQPSALPVATPSEAFESWWRKSVHDGFLPNTALAAKSLTLKSDWDRGLVEAPRPTPGAFEIVFRTDPTIYDGRFSNNGWLQELPKPLTKLTWDNAALISPNTAKNLGIENAIGRKGGDTYVDTLKLTHQGRTISEPVPAWITPGQPDNVITVHLGYGRRRAGRVGNGHGFDVYGIRTSDSPWFAAEVQVERVPAEHLLAVTQLHFLIEGRDILRSSTLDEYRQGKQEPNEQEPPAQDDTLYPNYDYRNQGMGYAWGMAIDLNNCVGCNACTIACQSENNIPIVGKEQIVRSREMHWIRVDTYFKGDDANNPAGTHFMPVPCMHCENAPCEPVCPVHATVHSAEGINDMVYNRCVGTRYCSNNCPYKVRRFNFLLYQDWEAPTYQLMRNPEVSVRSRGVMEKCTFCVQRIQGAKIQAEMEDRKVRDGEIVTACQAVCPTEAIVFGDINDPNSRVSRLKADQRNYSLLAELNTRPRTTYLSALRNPNPEIRK